MEPVSFEAPRGDLLGDALMLLCKLCNPLWERKKQNENVQLLLLALGEEVVNVVFDAATDERTMGKKKKKRSKRKSHCQGKISRNRQKKGRRLLQLNYAQKKPCTTNPKCGYRILSELK